MHLDDLGDLLKSRECAEIWYFHTDHFEPWSFSIGDDSARAVDRMAAMARSSRFARKLSLFYNVFIPYRLVSAADGSAVRVVDDGIEFAPRSERQEILARDAIRPLVTDDAHELHLHVHHEFWTRNRSEFDNPVSRWVNAASTPEMDEARLDLHFRLCKEAIARELGRPFERWAFIHGNWALNGSDPLICQVSDEMAMIMRHGGFGDFSFPAGRGYCDPKIEAPFTCAPIDALRAYDDPGGEALALGLGTRVLRPDRFFIWNSLIKSNFSSLDYYSSSNRDRFKTPERVVREWLAKSVVLDRCLFLKTHAHTMKSEYRLAEPGASIPHLYPDVIKIFDYLSRVCDRVGVALKPVTVTEVMARLGDLDGSVGAPEPTFTPAFASRRATRGTEAAPSALHDIPPALERRSQSALRDLIAADWRRQTSATGVREHLANLSTSLPDCERNLLEFLISECSASQTNIVVPNAGDGLLGFILAAAGFTVAALEADRSRFAVMSVLAAKSGLRTSELRQHIQPIFGWFPDAFHREMLVAGRRNILLLMPGATRSPTLDQKERMLRAAAAFDDVLIDEAQFCAVHREGAAEDYRQIADSYRLRRLIWRDEREDIWHIQPVTVFAGRLRRRSHATPETSKPAVRAPRFIEVRTLAVEAEALNNELLDMHLTWRGRVGGERFAADNLYRSKLERGAALEPHEMAIGAAITRHYSTETTKIVEIGSGYGGFAVLLARNGFEVLSFEGNKARYAAADWHFKQQIERYPSLGARLAVGRGFFPKVFSTNDFAAGKMHLCVATNITCSYTAANQEAVLRAAVAFDEVIVDLARFGEVRNRQAERDGLFEALASSYFEPVERLLFQEPYEYWRFRTRPFLSSRVRQ